MGESFPSKQAEQAPAVDPVAAEIANAGLVAAHAKAVEASGTATPAEVAQAQAAAEHYTNQAAAVWEADMAANPDHWVEAQPPAPSGEQAVNPATEIPDF